MKRLGVLVFAASLFFAGAAGAAPPEPAVVLPHDLVSAIRARLTATLMDAETARIVVTRGPRTAVYPINEEVALRGQAVCAQINAKNAYGAYVGQRAWVFLFRVGGIGAWPVDDAGIFEDVVTSECSKPAD